MGRLGGKVAVITGGAGGIGSAAAKLFVKEGAKVLLVDIMERGLKKAVREIEGDNASYVKADVTQPEQVKKYVETAVERYGGIDVFVNNAGMMGAIGPIWNYPTDTFRKVLEVNVLGVWLGMKYVIPKMGHRNRGGSIIVTSSIAGIRGFAATSGYVASKHAVIGIMRSVAHECAPMDIRVNAVSPGAVDTDMLFEGFPPDETEARKKAVAATSPMRRICKPEEVAQLMLFLASDESSFCTGGVYSVDGGMSA